MLLHSLSFQCIIAFSEKCSASHLLKEERRGGAKEFPYEWMRPVCYNVYASSHIYYTTVEAHEKSKIGQYCAFNYCHNRCSRLRCFRLICSRSPVICTRTTWQMNDEKRARMFKLVRKRSLAVNRQRASAQRIAAGAAPS